MAAIGTANNNNDAIPIEDSLLFELDETSLFEANGASGFDLYEGGGKLAAGLTARAKFKGGAELSGIVGQRWRSIEDDSFDLTSNLNGKTSDWVAGVAADFGNVLKLQTRARFGDNGRDTDGYSLNRLDASVSTRVSRLTARARYYKIEDTVSATEVPDEGIDLHASVRLTDNFSVVYGRRRDIAGTPIILRDPFTGAIVTEPGTSDPVIIAEPRDLLHSIGVAYDDECSRFEISFARSEALDRTIGPNDSIQFRFSLKTLGDFGSADVD